MTNYSKPFSKADHEAITANIAVFGELKGGRALAYPADQERASSVLVKK